MSELTNMIQASQCSKLRSDLWPSHLVQLDLLTQNNVQVALCESLLIAMNQSMIELGFEVHHSLGNLIGLPNLLPVPVEACPGILEHALELWLWLKE